MRAFRLFAPELYHLIRVEEIKSFDALLAKYGRVTAVKCKPTVGSLLASCWNEYILKPQHTPLQDSNDLYLGNIQKDGTYSVIPRTAGGEITPQGLMTLGEVARQYNLTPKSPVHSASACSGRSAMTCRPSGHS